MPLSLRFFPKRKLILTFYLLFISTGNGLVNFLPRFLTFFLDCLWCCCFRLAITLGFVGFEFYSVFPGQSEYVHNSSLELLDGELES